MTWLVLLLGAGLAVFLLRKIAWRLPTSMRFGLPGAIAMADVRLKKSPPKRALAGRQLAAASSVRHSREPPAYSRSGAFGSIR